MRSTKRMKFAAMACVSLIGAATYPGFASVGAAVHIVQHGTHAQMGTAQIFSDTADAKAEIRTAILLAASEHKNVILDFGGNWCADCQLLNIYFHDPGNAALLAANYVVVDVNVGEYDKNLDVVRRYGIPLNLGVPALAVLDGSGHLLYAQKHGEFEKIHQLDSSAVQAFLEKWKPRPRTSHHGAGHKKVQGSQLSGN